MKPFTKIWLAAVGGMLLASIATFAQVSTGIIANLPGSSRARGPVAALSVELVDASGNQITTFGGSGGTSASDDAAFSLGSASSITPAGFLVDDVAPDTADEGDAGIARMSPSRILYSAISNQGGTLWGTIRDLAANDSLNVAIVDGSGNQITSFGGGTQKAEDDASANADVGTLAFAIRDDTLDARSGTEGDFEYLHTNANGALWIIDVNSASALTALQLIDNIVVVEDAVAGNAWSGVGMLAVRQDSQSALAADGDFYPATIASDGGLRVHIENGGSGTSATDDGVFTIASTLVTPVGFLADETSPDSVNEGDTGAARMTLNRIALSNPRDSADAQLFGLAAALADDTANPTLGAVASYLMCYDGSTWDRCRSASVLEDAAESSGVAGSVQLGVRRNAAASSSGADGDYSTFNVDALGLTWSRHLDPCSGVAKTYLPVNIASATTTEITPSLAGASTHYYVCAINLVASAADNVALVDDDTDNCGSVTSGLAGGTSAGSGWNLGANGGLAQGNGDSSIMKTNGTNRVLCLVTSSAAQLSGTIVVAAAP